MTLRSCGRDTVPMIGPRRARVARPSGSGSRGFRARCRVRGEPDVIGANGISHRDGPEKGDGPPEQTGLVTNDKIKSASSRAQ